MIITSLEIFGFGKFHQFSLHFSDKYNVIYGENEAGKSTLHSFIRAMLFGVPSTSSRKEQFFRYRPFQKELPFGGKLSFTFQGAEYSITRDFLRNSLLVQENRSQKNMSNPETFLETVLSSFSSESFDNTVFIRQLKSGTDREMVKELQRIFSNMENSGDMHIDMDAAMEYLNRVEDKIKQQFYSHAEKEYSSLLGEVKNQQRAIRAGSIFEEDSILTEEEKEKEDTAVHSPDTETETVVFSSAIKTEETDKPADFKENQIQNKITELLEVQQTVQNLENAVQRDGFHTEEELNEEEKEVKKILAESDENGTDKRQNAVFPVFLGVLSLLFFLYAIFSALYFYTELPMPEIFSLRINSIPLFYPATCAGAFFAAYACTTSLEYKHRNNTEKKRSTFLQNLSSKRNLGQFRSFLNSSKEEVDNTTTNDFITADVLEKYYTEMRNKFILLNENKNKIEALHKEIADLKAEETAVLERKRAVLQEEEMLENQLRQISHLQNRAEQIRPSLSVNEALREQLDAVSEARSRIESLSKEIFHSFAYYLNQETAKVLSNITNTRYDSLFIDQNLRIFVNTEEKYLPLEQASTGTIDQLYLSLRLAMAKLLQEKQKEYLPLLFDDSFAMYDETRLGAALSFLATEYPSQILLFTCHKREGSVLESKEIPFHKITL